MPTVGCDPEILIVDRHGGIVPANTIFGDMNTNCGPEGGIGRDGSRYLAEIRPAPSIDPGKVVRRMARLMSKLVQHIPTDLYGGLYVGNYHARIGGIGGHFHTWGRERTEKLLRSERYDNPICLGLSYLWRLENTQQGVYRRAKSYGALLDMRWSNKSREFRSPSADWMAHPTLAFHCLSFFQTLINKATQLFPDPAQRFTLINLGRTYWMNSTKDETRNDYLQLVEREIKKLVPSKHMSAIDFFAERLDRLRDKSKLIHLDVDKWEAKASCAE